MELVATALISILLDRLVSTRAATIGLCVCLVLVIFLHWGEIVSLVRKHPSVPSATAPLTPSNTPVSKPSEPPGLPPDKPHVRKEVAGPLTKQNEVPKSTPEADKTPVQTNGLELAVSLVGSTDPTIVVDNQTDNLADGITWELVMFRTTDQAFFSYATQNIGYVKPHSKSARYAMQLNTLAQAPGGGGQIANGQSFIGTLVVDCPTCIGTTLIVSFVWGSSGWFYEVPGRNGQLLMPKDLSKDMISKFIEAMNTAVKAEDRTPIRDISLH